MPFCVKPQSNGYVMTVDGPIPAKDMGTTLVHEHILLGDSEVDPANHNWDIEAITKRMLPYLEEIKADCHTFVECTPVYIGRDPLLLKVLSEATGIRFITNTGYYGAEFALKPHIYTETADQLTDRWVDEWENGIGSTGIKPDFIKISVDRGKLSELHRKLITAAARTHLKTGLVIMSHTGPTEPAFEQIGVLLQEGVSPDAFIWTHAQDEKNPELHAQAARMGAWVSLDGVSGGNVDEYVGMLKALKDRDVLHRVLISHDAGWYKLEEENGGEIRGFTALFKKLLPRLKEAGFSEEDITQLMVRNPAEAFEIKIRKTNLVTH